MLNFLGRNFQRVVVDRVNDRLHSENPYGRLSPFFINVARMILSNTGNGNALINIINAASSAQIRGDLVDSVGGAYTPVANVAAIPAAPGEGSRVEVMDSTGIESLTPLTGVPPGFVGSDQVKVRLIYTGGTWTWAGSFPVDPGSYYLLRSELSDSVASDSTTTPASVKGVKTAYTTAAAAQVDASAALSAATTASANASSAVSTANNAATLASGALQRSGGAMTGAIDFHTSQMIDDLKFTTSGTYTSPGSLTAVSYSINRTLADKLSEMPSVLDFIPESEHAAIRNKASSYDCTLAFQRAIDKHGRVYVPDGGYIISSTLTLQDDYSGLIGDPKMPYIYHANATSVPAIQINARAAGNPPPPDGITEFVRIENIALWHGTPSSNPRPVFPTTPANSLGTVSQYAGIVIKNTGSIASPAIQRTLIQNVRVIGWGVAVYVGASVNTRLDRVVIEHHTNWAANNNGVTAANRYIGVLLDCTPVLVGGISPQASIELTHCIVNANNGTGAAGSGSAPSAVTAFGFYALGSDVRDIFMTSCETVNGNYGIFIEATQSDWNWDVHILRPIIDAYLVAGIVLKNLNGPAAATINGGYVVRNGNLNVGLAGVFLENCTGCFIGGGFQALGYTSADEDDCGIRLDAGSRNVINGAVVVNHRFGVSLFGSNLNTIIGSSIGAGATALAAGDVQTLDAAIRITDSSNGNLIVGNTIRGESPSNPYQGGVFVNNGCVGNQVVGNMIEAATVVTPVDISSPLDNPQRLEAPIRGRGSQHVSSDVTLYLTSYLGPQVYRGNAILDGSCHVFKNGSNADIGRIGNDGVYVPLSDVNRKAEIEPLGAVLAKLQQLSGKTYIIPGGDDARRIGMIAQEVGDVFPEAVYQYEDFIGLNYMALVPVLVNAVNELTARVEDLEGGR